MQAHVLACLNASATGIVLTPVGKTPPAWLTRESNEQPGWRLRRLPEPGKEEVHSDAAVEVVPVLHRVIFPATAAAAVSQPPMLPAALPECAGFPLVATARRASLDALWSSHAATCVQRLQEWCATAADGGHGVPAHHRGIVAWANSRLAAMDAPFAARYGASADHCGAFPPLVAGIDFRATNSGHEEPWYQATYSPTALPAACARFHGTAGLVALPQCLDPLPIAVSIAAASLRHVEEHVPHFRARASCRSCRDVSTQRSCMAVDASCLLATIHVVPPVVAEATLYLEEQAGGGCKEREGQADCDVERKPGGAASQPREQEEGAAFAERRLLALLERRELEVATVLAQRWPRCVLAVRQQVAGPLLFVLPAWSPARVAAYRAALLAELRPRRERLHTLGITLAVLTRDNAVDTIVRQDAVFLPIATLMRLVGGARYRPRGSGRAASEAIRRQRALEVLQRIHFAAVVVDGFKERQAEALQQVQAACRWGFTTDLPTTPHRAAMAAEWLRVAAANHPEEALPVGGVALRRAALRSTENWNVALALDPVLLDAVFVLRMSPWLRRHLQLPAVVWAVTPVTVEDAAAEDRIQQLAELRRYLMLGTRLQAALQGDAALLERLRVHHAMAGAAVTGSRGSGNGGSEVRRVLWQFLAHRVASSAARPPQGAAASHDECVICMEAYEDVAEQSRSAMRECLPGHADALAVLASLACMRVQLPCSHCICPCCWVQLASPQAEAEPLVRCPLCRDERTFLDAVVHVTRIPRDPKGSDGGGGGGGAAASGTEACPADPATKRELEAEQQVCPPWDAAVATRVATLVSAPASDGGASRASTGNVAVYCSSAAQAEHVLGHLQLRLPHAQRAQANVAGDPPSSPRQPPKRRRKNATKVPRGATTAAAARQPRVWLVRGEHQGEVGTATQQLQHPSLDRAVYVFAAPPHHEHAKPVGLTHILLAAPPLQVGTLHSVALHGAAWPAPSVTVEALWPRAWPRCPLHDAAMWHGAMKQEHWRKAWQAWRQGQAQGVAPNAGGTA